MEAKLTKKGEPAAKAAAKSKIARKTNTSSGKAKDKDKVSKAKTTAIFACGPLTQKIGSPGRRL